MNIEEVTSEQTAETRSDAQPRRPMRLRRLAALCTVAGALIAGSLTMSTGVAGAANAGTVLCGDGSPVVGVWVTVSGGTSGWATRRGTGDVSQNYWSYNTQGKNYKLTVGCGGTKQKWKYSISTPTFKKTWTNVTCVRGNCWEA